MPSTKVLQRRLLGQSFDLLSEFQQRTAGTKGLQRRLLWQSFGLFSESLYARPRPRGCRGAAFTHWIPCACRGAPVFGEPVPSELVKHTLVIVNFLLFKLSLIKEKEAPRRGAPRRPISVDFEGLLAFFHWLPVHVFPVLLFWLVFLLARFWSLF